MRSYADQLAAGLRARGHQVQELTAPVLLSRMTGKHSVLSKWLGYLDQFVLFSPLLWLRSLALPAGSLFVVADQALGPWIPWLKHRAHVVHVHDLLALEGAMGLQPFHSVGRSGQLYQLWIRQGFRQARCFLSVSAATRRALARQLPSRPLLSELLYNPLPRRFVRLPVDAAATEVSQMLPDLASRPFLLHIGTPWYKNRMGLLAIWEQLLQLGADVDLVLVGWLEPSLVAWIEQRCLLQPKLHVLTQASDGLVLALYNRAEALLFPSHAEGFGWPILEGMACGCPVITTDRAPMCEVGGDGVTLIPPCPVQPAAQRAWARKAARLVQVVLQRTPAEQQLARRRGLRQASRFGYDEWLDQLEAHYQRALALQEQH
jgi:glycosyltransferase involved in cell wall biosynthesis